MTLTSTLTAETDAERITFVYTVENTSDEPVTLEFSDAQTVEVVVGEDVWRYSAGRMFGQALHSERLDPGERLFERVVWPSPVAGTHTVRAWLCAREQECPAETTVTW